MVADAKNSARCEVLEQIATVADTPAYLPSFIAETRAADGLACVEQVAIRNKLNSKI